MNDNTFLIVARDGKFYVRHVAFTTQDNIAGEMVYRCDAPVGGVFDTFAEAGEALVAAQASWSGERTIGESTLGRLRGQTPNVQSLPRKGGKGSPSGSKT